MKRVMGAMGWMSLVFLSAGKCLDFQWRRTLPSSRFEDSGERLREQTLQRRKQVLQAKYFHRWKEGVREKRVQRKFFHQWKEHTELQKKKQLLEQEGIFFEPEKVQERFKAWADLLAFSDEPQNSLQIVQEELALREGFFLFLDALRIRDRWGALRFDREAFTPEERRQGAFDETQNRLKELLEPLPPGIPKAFLQGFYAYLAHPQSISEETRQDIDLPSEVPSPKAHFEALAGKLQRALVLQQKQTASRNWLSLGYVYGTGVEPHEKVAQEEARKVREAYLAQEIRTPSLSQWKQKQIAFQQRGEALLLDQKTSFLAQILKEDQEPPKPEKDQEQLLKNPFIDPWRLLGELIKMEKFEEAQILWERIPREKEGAVEEKRKAIWEELQRGKDQELAVEESCANALPFGEALLQDERSTLEDRRWVTLLTAKALQFRKAAELGKPLLKELRHTLEDQRLVAFCYASEPESLLQAWELYQSILEHPHSTLEDLTQAAAVGYLCGREPEARALWDQALKQKGYTQTEQAQVAQTLEHEGHLQAAAEAQGRIENWAQMGALLERCAEQNQGERKNRFLVQAAQAYEKQAQGEADPAQKAEILMRWAQRAEKAENFELAEQSYLQALESLKTAPEGTEVLQVKRAQCYQALGFLHRSRRKALFKICRKSSRRKIGQGEIYRKSSLGEKFCELEGKKPSLSLLKRFFPPEEEDFLSQARAQFLLLHQDQEYERLFPYGSTDEEEDFLIENESCFPPEEKEACLLFLRKRKEQLAEILQKAGKGRAGNSDWLVQAAWRWAELENWSKVDEISSFEVQEKSWLWKQKWPEIYRKAAKAQERKGYDSTAASYWKKAQQAAQAGGKERDAAYAGYRALCSELKDQKKVYQNIPKAKLPPELARAMETPQIRGLFSNHPDRIEDRKNEERRKQCSSRIQALERDISVSVIKLREQGILQW